MPPFIFLFFFFFSRCIIEVRVENVLWDLILEYCTLKNLFGVCDVTVKYDTTGVFREFIFGIHFLADNFWKDVTV